jgi:hypothetical protein
MGIFHYSNTFKIVLLLVVGVYLQKEKKVLCGWESGLARQGLATGVHTRIVNTDNVAKAFAA